MYSKFIQGRQCSGRIKQFLISSLKLIAMFLYGAALTLLVTMSLKAMVGRLRPHFMDTCRPELEFYNCTNRWVALPIFFQNQEIFVRLDELDELDRITHT